MDALAMALHIAYNYEGYKKALFKAVNIGGDCNTVAAIVGQIAGCIYGVDDEMLKLYKYVNEWDNFGIAIRAFRLYYHLGI